MKDLLANLWVLLKATSTQTRLVVGAGVLLTLAVSGVMSYRSANPHLIPAWTGLSNAEFSAVTNALATAGVRFDSSSPPGPFSVFVPENELWDARNAVAINSALDVGPKGIQINYGASSIFDPSAKRLQETQKRDWQDLEAQIEGLSFIESASVRMSGPASSPFMQTRPPTVTLVVRVRGAIGLDATQRRGLASIVRTGAGVPDENITITDQYATLLFDGNADQTLGDQLRFERDWADDLSGRAQAQLDAIFGPGMSRVSVSGQFDHDSQESVNEALDPTKLKVNESLLESITPIDAQSGAPVSGASGGPAGLQANLQASTPTPRGTPSEATEREESTQYTYGRTTTHVKSGAPRLERLTVALALHESLAARLDSAEALVKQVVAFNEERGDDISSAALPMVGVTLDSDGKPIFPTPEPPPEPPNKLMMILLERGIEILAAAAFLFVLLRSLKRGSSKTQLAGADGMVVPRASTKRALPVIPEEEIDLDLLARQHVEQLLEEDPERVAALLSRWALGENFYAGSKS